MLATAAAVIASQATISGAFSMARQAVHLDLLPRLRVLQTSAHEQGQIYVPIVNWLVFRAVCCSSSASAPPTPSGRLRRGGRGHHGGDHDPGRVRGRHAVELAACGGWAVFGLLLVTDCAFVAGNLTKLPNGGWIPLSLGAVLCLYS